MKQLLDRFASMEKAAQATLAAEPGALVGVNDLPGSEHDAKVPAEAKKPDAEVTQGQPAGATTAEGAVNGGDAKPLNEGKLEVDQPLENPEQKPAITDDALTAKEAEAHLGKLIGDLLSDIRTGKEQATKQAQDATPAAAEAKKGEPKDGGEKTATAKTDAPKIELTDEMLSKLAAAVASFNAGRKAADEAIKQAEAAQVEKQASEQVHAIAMVKAACIKAAQDAGLDPAAAEAAAVNAMATAGVPADAVAAVPAAPDAAGADDTATAAAPADVQLPDDVTEEELGAAIVDLVQSGQLDADTAKALVDEIAGDEGAAAAGAGDITEDQAAEIIANGLKSGEITPEQAQAIVAAVEGEGAAAGAAADAGAADAEAQGAADAAVAAQNAADEAQGAADAEAAIKQAAAQLRANTIQKVAAHIAGKREQVKQAAAKQSASPLLTKVASILQPSKDALVEKQAAAQKQAPANDAQSKYLAGFCKKAAELGIDPRLLAKYALANQK